MVGREDGAYVLGSSVSAREVKPTRSTKMTVTIRRSSRDGGVPPASGRPHVRQNWAIGGFSCPHAAQTVMNRVYGLRCGRWPEVSGTENSSVSR